MASPYASDPTELSRDLGFFAVFATATGTMIGAGIFILPGIAAEAAGPGAAVSFLFAGLIASIAALSASELATAMPKAGGPYYFVSRAMGPALGTVVGLGAWLALVLKGSFALVGLGQYVFHFTPVPIVLTAVVAGILLVAVNYLGAGFSGMLQNIIVVLLLGIMGVFVFFGLGAVDMQTLRPLVPFGWSAIIATTGLVFISYLGIVKAAAIAEEVSNPGRNLPWAILSSVVLVTVLYVGVMVVVTGVLPIAEIILLPAPLADAGRVFLGFTGGVMVGIAGILATTSTGNAAILSSSRYPFAMSRDGLMTAWFSGVNRRFRTPSRSILVTGGLMIGLVLLFDVEALARLGGVFGILVFALVNLSVVILRRVSPTEYRPAFRAPFYPWLQLVGALAALALVPQIGLMPQIGAIAFILAGLGWFSWQRHRVGSDAIQPAYGLVDKLRRVRAVQAAEAKERALAESRAPTPSAGSVVVELEAHRPNKHLLTVAAALARRHGAAVDAVTVTEVPLQTPLGMAVRGPSPAFIRKVQRRLEEHGVELRFHHIQGHDRARAILNLVDKETRMVLLDWRPPFRWTRLRGSHVEHILRVSPARVGVLKFRGIETYERILVATGGGPYAKAEVEVADAVAEMTGARVTFLMIIPTDASPGRHEHAREYLERLNAMTSAPTDMVVLPNDNVVEAIISAGRRFDLIVLGASREPAYRRLIGRIPDIVAGHADRSVLVTQDPGFPQVWRPRLNAVLNHLRGRSDPREEVTVEPLPPDVRNP